MKTCPFCKGNIETHKIDHMHKWGSEFYLFENTEAEVCKQCGEIFFRPDTLKLFDKYVAEKKKGKRTIHVPVIEMSSTARA
ncbi:MAG: YgiT-type zinc finger protein [Thermodesulfovibrionia bacterium]|nr:YgiT-type zinc finger protein [Thermodesulfovibrionia bacterium]